MNICIFASGAGSNFNAILRSAKEGYLSSKISLLITNNSGSGAAQIALENGVECLHISRKKFAELADTEYSELILRELVSRDIDFVVLCGYMKMMEESVTGHFKDRIINIHPALLPSFGGKGMYGINVHKAVIDSGAKVSGITIHFVDGGYDTGRIIFQKCCEVNDSDDEFTLAERIRGMEHRYYPEVIRKFEEQKIIVEGNKIQVRKLTHP